MKHTIEAFNPTTEGQRAKDTRRKMITYPLGFMIGHNGMRLAIGAEMTTFSFSVNMAALGIILTSVFIFLMLRMHEHRGLEPHQVDILNKFYALPEAARGGMELSAGNVKDIPKGDATKITGQIYYLNNAHKRRQELLNRRYAPESETIIDHLNSTIAYTKQDIAELRKEMGLPTPKKGP